MFARMNLKAAAMMTAIALGAAAMTGAAVVDPISATSNTAGSDFRPASNLANGIGLSGAEPRVHVFGSFETSWVTAGSGSDYFVAGTSPVISFDLGANMLVTKIYTWAYGGTTGVAGTIQANSAKDYSLAFATAAEGTGGFGSSIAYNPGFVAAAPPAQGAAASIPRDAEAFTTPVYGRYVQMTVTDNYAGEPGTLGGDRAGLGAVAFEAFEIKLINPLSVTTNVAGDAGTHVDHLIDGSGLSAAPTVDTVSAVTHTGYTDGSAHYVTPATSGGSNDYYLSGTTPVLVFDLGSVRALTHVALWPYTGQAFDASGNSVSQIDLKFSDDLDFSASPLVSLNPAQPANSSGANPGELLALGGIYSGRYVQLTLTDNFFGALNGGDRVGLGEVRFAAIVPAPLALPAGLMMMGAMLMRRCK